MEGIKLKDRHEVGTFDFVIEVLERTMSERSSYAGHFVNSPGPSESFTETEDELRQLLFKRHEDLQKTARESIMRHMGSAVRVSDVDIRKGSIKLFFILYLVANYADVKDGIEGVISDVTHFVRSCASNTSVVGTFHKGGLEEYLRLRKEMSDRFRRDMLFLATVTVIALLYWFE